MIPQGAMLKLGASANLTPEQIADVPQPERRWDKLLDMVFPPGRPTSRNPRCTAVL